MKIIGFSGKMSAGKDTARNFLLLELKYRNIYSVNFADALKQMVIDLFVPSEWNLSVLDLALDENKQKVLPSGRTIREVLQWFGTEVCRSEDEACWINVYKKVVKKIFDHNPASLVITTDVRFKNELQAIQELGGKVIRLLRNPFDKKHVSEIALDEVELNFTHKGLKFDAIIDNREMTIAQCNTVVWDILNTNQWI
jgi:hypothetical protein